MTIRLPRSRTGRLTGGVLALAVAFVGTWEGLRLTAYRDIVGVPTVCYGETRGVEIGDSYTKAECDEMFGTALQDFAESVDACINEELLPAKSYVAIVSLAYNIGPNAFCGSTAARRINAGDIAGACEAATWWNRAGGRVVRGLTNRRSAEYELCMEGVEEGL